MDKESDLVFTERMERECCEHLYESACACCIGECDTCSITTTREGKR